MNYFWLQKHNEQWQAAMQNNHKPQAVIISGLKGVGKTVLLNKIITDLLCRKSTTSCGECQNCYLFKQGTHPDVRHIQPENNLIKVKMIRELTQFYTSTPHCSDFKISVINQADTMNTAAANSLLKVLEEPPSRGILFLMSDVEHQLMPTIRSRCITLNVHLNQNEKDKLETWINDNYSFDQRLSKKALVINDYLPGLTINMLENDQIGVFEEMLDCFYVALSANDSVVSCAKKLSDYELSYWSLLQSYIVLVTKQSLKQNFDNEFSNDLLNLLINKSAKVIHILIKFTELIQLVMLNLNNQVKNQLLIESMLFEIKNDLNDRV